eukprot:403366291
MTNEDIQPQNAKYFKGKLVISCLSTFVIGLALGQAVVANDTFKSIFSSDSNIFVQSKFLSNLWFDQPIMNFTWSEVPLYNLTFDTKGFKNVFVSPKGEVYGIQTFNIPGETINRCYKYNNTFSQWQLAFQRMSVELIRFDKEGNFYLLDIDGNMYAKNSQTQILLQNILDFQIQYNGTIYAITDYDLKPQYPPGLSIFYYSSNYNKRLDIFNGLPIKIDLSWKITDIKQNQSYQSFQEMSVGKDNSLWAINMYNNVMKYNNDTMDWVQIEGLKAKKIAAYNEISVAILDLNNTIQLSSIKQQVAPPTNDTQGHRVKSDLEIEYNIQE